MKNKKKEGIEKNDVREKVVLNSFVISLFQGSTYVSRARISFGVDRKLGLGFLKVEFCAVLQEDKSVFSRGPSLFFGLLISADYCCWRCDGGWWALISDINFLLTLIW